MKSIFEILKLPKELYEDMPLPKGLGAFNILPVDLVTLSYSDTDTWLQGKDP